MKILLYATGLFLLVLACGYKLVSYKNISTQELAYEKLSKAGMQESPRNFPDSVKMDEIEFWQIIDGAKKQYPDNPKSQVQYMISNLAELPDARLKGFEFTFREKMIALWNYNVKAMYQITENDNYISADDFIYFRAYLISLGKERYRQALRDTDHFTTLVDRKAWSGKEMLSVADRAYLKKHTRMDVAHCHRCIATEVSYDSGSYMMTGVYTSPGDFENKFPNLTGKY